MKPVSWWCINQKGIHGMAKSFAQSKGCRAERQVVQILQPVVTKVYSELGCPEDQIPQLERNLMQSHKGGYDLVGIEWMALEVKHQETLHINQWWNQTKSQVQTRVDSAGNRVEQSPVLFYKQNRTKWRVMMFGQLPLPNDRKVRCPVDISLESFMLYFEHRLKMEIQNGHL